jgi:hypothetical protein
MLRSQKRPAPKLKTTASQVTRIIAGPRLALMPYGLKTSLKAPSRDENIAVAVMEAARMNNEDIC